MARLAWLSVPLGFLGALGACDDSTGTGGSGPGSGPSGPVTVGSNTGGGSNNSNSGDCNSSADCPPNGTCVALTLGGFRVCQYPVSQTDSCMMMGQGGAGGGGGGGQGGGPVTDECCPGVDGMECNDDDVCVSRPLIPTCGPSMEPEQNVCAGDQDQCNNAGDCGSNQLCLPAGTFDNKIRMCIPITCGSDVECSAKPGGTCVPVERPCCGVIRGLFCSYAGEGCRKDADCPGGYCDVVGNVAQCVSGTCN